MVCYCLYRRYFAFQIEEELAAIQAANSLASAEKVTESYNRSSHKKQRLRRESHVSPETLTTWFKKQLESYDCLAVNDMTYSFQNGLALCAIIHRYKKNIIQGIVFSCVLINYFCFSVSDIGLTSWTFKPWMLPLGLKTTSWPLIS